MKYDNLENKKFGKLTVKLKTDDKLYTKSGNEVKGVKYYCDCECGVQNVLTTGSILNNGNKLSCGCMKVGGSNKIDLTGLRIGNLVVIKEIKNNNTSSAL